ADEMHGFAEPAGMIDHALPDRAGLVHLLQYQPFLPGGVVAQLDVAVPAVADDILHGVERGVAGRQLIGRQRLLEDEEALEIEEVVLHLRRGAGLSRKLVHAETILRGPVRTRWRAVSARRVVESTLP